MNMSCSSAHAAIQNQFDHERNLDRVIRLIAGKNTAMTSRNMKVGFYRQIIFGGSVTRFEREKRHLVGERTDGE